MLCFTAFEKVNVISNFVLEIYVTFIIYVSKESVQKYADSYHEDMFPSTNQASFSSSIRVPNLIVLRFLFLWILNEQSAKRKIEAQPIAAMLITIALNWELDRITLGL